ncbi:PepSY domain-containing protein [Gluconobacter kondonii]|uniref:PepSY-associated TM helix domain-containing protein n=1 Tax=Gluconobacter kondonii TaxID=941463 RepID=UPI00209E34BD|nr:PepSY-associated TM helix domain-containing protein [Gluconobacter kondonii]MCP1237879.1 PepSY domain-containing protein [Gluconobacter kondonii]
MKIRSDILRVYREVHSWVGICAGLLLFVAFFAGAISMFEQPLQNLTSPQLDMPPPVPLSRTPDLLEKVFSAYPQARQTYTVLLAPDRGLPGRVAWPVHPPHGHDAGPMFVATLTPDGTLVVRQQAITPVAHFIDMLHQELGIPLPHAISRPFMGIIALLYGMALISGVLLFLPTLARNLFAFRFREGPRKLWLDLHNLLGFFSLPFHIVMALTSVVFAFHDPIFAVQSRVFGTSHTSPHSPTHTRPHPITADQHPDAPLLTPTELVTSLETQASGFVPTILAYSQGHGGTMLRVSGQDSRYSMRGPTAGFATVDPRSGKILSADYLPGHQKTGFAILTVFFALHFGSFGGNAIRWGYVVLGLAGAGMFYTGNRLWIDARRRREKAAGLSRDSLPTKILSRLTPGWVTGCITGCLVILTAGYFCPDVMTVALVKEIYYAVFIVFIAFFMLKP